MSSKEIFRIYGVETDQGFTQYYTTKEEALDNSKDGVVELKKVSMEKAHNLVTRWYTTASKRSLAGCKGQQARFNKYSAEERSNQSKAGGIVRAEQRWGKK